MPIKKSHSASAVSTRTESGQQEHRKPSSTPQTVEGTRVVAAKYGKTWRVMIQSKKELADLTVASGEQWLTELSNDELKALVAL